MRGEQCFCAACFGPAGEGFHSIRFSAEGLVEFDRVFCQACFDAALAVANALVTRTRRVVVELRGVEAQTQIVAEKVGDLFKRGTP